MKICGWRRSISYSAVVPLLGLPDDEEVGHPLGSRRVRRIRWLNAPLRHARSRACRSVEAVIAPQAHQVALQVLAQRRHLGREAPAQLAPSAARPAWGGAPKTTPRRTGASPAWRTAWSVSALTDAFTARTAGRARPTPRARARRRRCERISTVGFASTGSIGAVSSTSRKRSTLRTVASLSRAEVVVDQHQHLLAREHARGSGAAARRSGRARSRAAPGAAASGAGSLGPARRCGSSASARRRSCSVSTWSCTVCRCSERRKLAGSRRIATMRASGAQRRRSAPRRCATRGRRRRPRRRAGRARAAANSARYSSSVSAARRCACAPVARAARARGTTAP